MHLVYGIAIGLQKNNTEGMYSLFKGVFLYTQRNPSKEIGQTKQKNMVASAWPIHI